MTSGQDGVPFRAQVVDEAIPEVWFGIGPVRFPDRGKLDAANGRWLVRRIPRSPMHSVMLDTGMVGSSIPRTRRFMQCQASGRLDERLQVERMTLTYCSGPIRQDDCKLQARVGGVNGRLIRVQMAAECPAQLWREA
jgi:hypothetical protein